MKTVPSISVPSVALIVTVYAFFISASTHPSTSSLPVVVLRLNGPPSLSASVYVTTPLRPPSWLSAALNLCIRSPISAAEESIVEQLPSCSNSVDVTPTSLGGKTGGYSLIRITLIVTDVSLVRILPLKDSMTLTVK